MIKKLITFLLRASMFVLAIALVVFVFLYTRSGPVLQNAAAFKDVPIDIAHFGLFDLGVADVNQDAMLDMFTTNHSAPQSVLVNQGNGQFENQFSAMKLDQDGMFPGLVVFPQQKSVSEPGIYIRWNGPSIVVRAHKMSNLGKFAGKVEVMSPLVIKGKQNINADVKSETIANGVTRSEIQFHGMVDGYFAFKPYLHALPIKFTFAPGIAPQSIFVGSKSVSPPTLEFSINMKDRHGMAWVDYNNDGRSDVFITRGGQKGWIGRMPEPYWDELFVSGSGQYHNIGQGAGLIKDDCSGRQTAWVDYNSDGRLDIYVSCGKASEYQSNKLFEQMADGSFKNVAQYTGVDIAAEGSFIWLDADADGDTDLFWVDERSFYLYENDSGRFTSRHLGANPAQHVVKKLTATDFDMDGDLDVFSASPAGNALCINTGGDFIIADPSAWGLSRKSMTANWVDYDNDGLLDLHTLPGGMFQQIKPGKFKRTAILGIEGDKFSYNNLRAALASWFDMDNDGMRDLIVALNYRFKETWWAKGMVALKGDKDRLGGLKDYWQARLMVNKVESGNHWLQVDLKGTPGNSPGIGSIVTVSVPGTEKQYMQQVGMSDGSRFSQGHYRSYFGLGEYMGPVNVSVKWPDGHVQELNDTRLNQRILVTRN